MPVYMTPSSNLFLKILTIVYFKSYLQYKKLVWTQYVAQMQYICK